MSQNRIGTYQGYPCYKTTQPSYVGNKCYENNNNIYIIGDKMIYQNVVIGTYDGKYVTDFDRDKQYTYYTKPKAASVEVKAAEEVAVDAIGPVYSTSADDILAGVYNVSVASLIGMEEECVG